MKSRLFAILAAFCAFAAIAAKMDIYEGEDVAGAVRVKDARASGGMVAGQIPAGGSLVFGKVAAQSEGLHVLTLETFDTQVREVELVLNGKSAGKRKIAPGYDNTAGKDNWEVLLSKGENTAEFRSAGAMPSIDRLCVTRVISVTDAPGRESASFDNGWRFAWGAVKGGDPRKAGFDDSQWRTVDLPHDAQFERPWGRDGSSGARGFKPMGEMWYRKTFTLAELGLATEGKRVFLELGGLLCVGDVYLNGEKVASTEYGYLPVWTELTARLKTEGENVIAVWCSTGKRGGSRWYTGAGLYRDAKIVALPQVSIARHGIFARGMPEGDVRITVELDGFRGKGNSVKLEAVAEVKDSAGKTLACATVRAPWSKNPRQELELAMKLEKPVLWDVDAPNLYTAEVRLVYDGKEIDRDAVRFGIKKVELDYAYGMKLNGRKIFLASVSGHHDLGAVGVAAYRRAIRRQFELLKSLGFNAIRCSHNPYSEDFYELADELGILVVDELVDKWADKDYWFGRKPFTAIWPQMVTQWMKRDRNHASIFAWSFGNELQMRNDLCGYEGLNDWGVTMYRVIKALSLRWDDTRPTTVAMYPSREGAIYKNDPGFWAEENLRAPEMSIVTDFASLNYQWAAYGSYVKHSPGLNIFQSEAAMKELQAPYFGMDREHSIGCSWWGFISYWGESNAWPKKGWNYSGVTHALEPKPVAYLIKSAISPESVVAIAVQAGKGESVEWNDVQVGMADEIAAWEGKPGEKKNIRIYTNCGEAELFLNGKSLGRKPNNGMKPEERNIVSFSVPFEPGTLVARGYNDGKEAASARVATAGKAVKMIALAEADDYKADGKDLIYVRCRAVDGEGNQARAYNGNVAFSCEGAAKFLACDNDDHYTDELFTPDIDAKRAKDGFILGIFRCADKPGKVRITVVPEGLQPQTLELDVMQP